MAANDSPAPLFETDDERASFVVRLPVHPLVQQSATEVIGEVERLMRVLLGEMSRKQIQDALALGHEDHFRNAYLTPALNALMVEMTLPQTPRSPSSVTD
jgi:ATP-dependent DNA helicase RecG